MPLAFLTTSLMSPNGRSVQKVRMQQCTSHRTKLKNLVVFLLQANICPQLPEPAVEIWDSYALLERTGLTYRYCVTNTSKTMCPQIKTHLKDTEFKGTQGGTDFFLDLYMLTYVPETNLTTSLSSLFVNITFSESLLQSPVSTLNMTVRFES